MLLKAVIFFEKISKLLMYSAIIISEFLFKKTELSLVSLMKLKDIKVILKILFHTYSDCFKLYKLLIK